MVDYEIDPTGFPVSGCLGLLVLFTVDGLPAELLIYLLIVGDLQKSIDRDGRYDDAPSNASAADLSTPDSLSNQPLADSKQIGSFRDADCFLVIFHYVCLQLVTRDALCNTGYWVGLLRGIVTSVTVALSRASETFPYWQQISGGTTRCRTVALLRVNRERGKRTRDQDTPGREIP